MKYLITTSYRDIIYSHFVKGLSSSDIQNLLKPDSIVPYEDIDNWTSWGQDRLFDLVSELEIEGKRFQIISSIPKIVDFYDWLKWINPALSPVSMNSKSHPLPEDQMHALLKKLNDQYVQKKQIITPATQELIAEIQNDIRDFNVRYKGYASEQDLDILQTRSHDLDGFAEQGIIGPIKDRIQQIIEKMELLESNFVKQINVDKDKPLEEFNKELHSVMNQNRLSRYHGLNQLSGGSALDLFIYKALSRFKFWRDSFGSQVHNFEELFAVFIKEGLLIFIWWTIFWLIGLFFIKHFYDEELQYPLVKLWFIGLTSTFCYSVAGKKLISSLVGIWFFILIWYYWYEFLRINLWL